MLREGGNCARTPPCSPGTISRQLMPEGLGSGQAHPDAAPEGVWEQPGEGQEGKTSWEAMKSSCIQRDPWAGRAGAAAAFLPGWGGISGTEIAQPGNAICHLGMPFATGEWHLSPGNAICHLAPSQPVNRTRAHQLSPGSCCCHRRQYRSIWDRALLKNLASSTQVLPGSLGIRSSLSPFGQWKVPRLQHSFAPWKPPWECGWG